MTLRTLLAWATLASGMLVACGDGPPLTSTVPGDSFPDADAVMMGGQHTFTNPDGIRSSVLRFDTLYSWNDSVDSEIRGVDLTVFNLDGSERARVTALGGTVDPLFQGFTAHGNVVVIIPSEGRRVETEELQFDPEGEQIRSETCFVMTAPGAAPVRGSSFVSDLEFRNFHVENTGGCP
jgi:LPS export ABC transporter protein LptC